MCLFTCLFICLFTCALSALAGLTALHVSACLSVCLSVCICVCLSSRDSSHVSSCASSCFSWRIALRFSSFVLFLFVKLQSCYARENHEKPSAVLRKLTFSLLGVHAGIIWVTKPPSRTSCVILSGSSQNETEFNPPCLTQTLFSLLVIQTGLGGAVSLGLGTPSPKWSRSSQALKVSFASSLQHAVLSVTAVIHW